MPFIGIVSKNENEVKEYIKSKDNLKIDSIFFINDKSINNIKNIKFDTILILDDKYNIENESILQKLILNSKYIIIQSEIQDKLNSIDNEELNLITFGFNHKSTVTASSTELENIMICIQRNIKNANGSMIEPQEILVKTKKCDINIIMGISILSLIYSDFRH